MKQYREQAAYFLRNVPYRVALILTLLLSYGYAVMTVSVNIDSLEGERYIGSGRVMLSSGRFGMNFWAGLLGYGTADPSYGAGIDLLAVLLLGMAAVGFCMLLRKVSGDCISMFGYVAFSCVFVSYPLINEIWEYSGANICVCGGYMLDALALNLLWDSWKHPLLRKKKALHMGLAALCLLVVCSAYESLAAVYVMAVFAILTLQQLVEKDKPTFGQLLKTGLWYAAALVGGLCLRVVMQKAIGLVLPPQIENSGATTILWSYYPADYLIKLLLKTLFIQYGMRACFYWPIAELLGALLLFVLLIVGAALKRKRPLFLLTGAGMLFSMVLLALLQGKCSPYRTCQTFALLVAWVAMAVYELLHRRLSRHQLAQDVLKGLVILLCVHQGMYLSHLLALNYQRSQEEADVVCAIGTELEKSYDTSKTVVLVGNYTLSDSITRYTTADPMQHPLYRFFREHTNEWETTDTVKYVDSNCNSVLNWSVDAFTETGDDYGTAAENLFDYYGFALSMRHSEGLHKQALRYVETHNVPSYPADGYITDCGTYILVNLG